MDTAIKLTAAAVCAALCALVIKKTEPSVAYGVTLAACAAVAAGAIAALEMIAEFVSKLEGDISGAEGSVTLLFKILAIAVVTCCGAQICRDCGEGALALKVELLGSVLCTLTALPLFEGVYAIAASFIKG